MEGDELLDSECQKLVGHQLLGKWHLDRLIGVGGMAAVYAATHRNGRVAAIKLLHKRFASLGEIVERFLREAYIANKIAHPGVVRVDDDGTTPDGQPLLVMELLDGDSLEKVQAERGGTLPVGDVMRILEKLLDVMEVAHAAGIVHRDLKPENLFLTRKGELKVLDFGIARILEGTEGVSRTRTGLVMGTPAFMAPEQALGRWKQVDARTDLWAIGAIGFNLITGRWVHDAPSANEMLVASASRPAPSLARFSRAPLAVVRCIDRALAYEQSKRFPDAATMHGDVMRVMIELGPTATEPPVAAPAPVVRDNRRADAPGANRLSEAATMGVPTAPEKSAPPRVRAPSAELIDRFDEDFPGLGDPTLVSDAFRQIERALVTRQQYGNGHPETARHFERAFAACELALDNQDEAFVWQITPYAFTLDGKVVWEPRAPLDRVPYQLFADGLRVLGFVRGVDRRQLAELVRIMSLDRVRDVAADDDYVTLLWDANLEHVVHQAIDAHADGDQETREEFERSAGDIAALAEFDTSFQLEECWQDARGARNAEAAETREARLMRLLAMADTRDREALVQAESFRSRELEPGVDTQSVLDLDAAALAVARARFESSAEVEARLSTVVAEAYRAAHGLGAAAALAVPLRAALETLAEASPPALAAFVVSLLAALVDRHAPGEARELRAALAGEAIGPRAARVLLTRAAEPGADESFGNALREVLSACGPALVGPALEALLGRPPAALADAIEQYLTQNAEGHEAEVAELFPKADVDLGLRLVRILVGGRSARGKELVMRAAESPHPIVRIEALSHVDGGSERLRLELRALVEDPEPAVRLNALRVIGSRTVRAAGPYLVMRIKAPGFDKLPLEERRQALVSLAALAPQRAESLCVELLGEGRLVTVEAHEETRALAAEVLADIAQSPEAIEALGVASKSRWKYSERVRTSAGRAKQAAEARLSSAPAPAPTSVVPSGWPSDASELARRRKP